MAPKFTFKNTDINLDIIIRSIPKHKPNDNFILELVSVMQYNPSFISNSSSKDPVSIIII